MERHTNKSGMWPPSKKPLVGVGWGKKASQGRRRKGSGELDVAKTRSGSLKFYVGSLVWYEPI